MGYGTLKKRFKERTRWMKSKSFPVSVDVVARYSFSVGFCIFSSSCCFVIVASSPSLMIISSFSFRFCTSYSSSRCSAKAIREYLGELNYHFFRTGFLRSIFDRQFWKVILLVLQQCSEDCVVIGGRSKTLVDVWTYMGIFVVWGYIGLCHWPRRWVDGAQCKCKCWFFLKAFLWTCWVIDYCQISSVGNFLPRRWYVKGKVSVGEVHEPKMRCTIANSPKTNSFTVICCSCVWSKNGK